VGEASLGFGLNALASAGAQPSWPGLVPPWLWVVAWQSPHPPLPQVLPMGGPTFTTPRVVPVLFGADPDAAALRDFFAKLGTTSYLKTATAEYGVASVTIAPPIVLPGAPPATALDTDVAAWLVSKLADPTFPQNDGQTVYAFVYPQGTAVSVTDFWGNVTALCGGHHGEASSATSPSIPFTMTGLCANNGGLGSLDFATRWTATSIVDAITNPSPFMVLPGYDDTDFAGSGWGQVTTPEIGLMCPQSESSVRPNDLGYLVPRVYSSVAAAANHNPCLPLPAGSGAYFTAAPVLDGNDNLVRGVKVPPGGSATVPLALFSDAPTGAWKLSAHELPGEATPSLTFSFDDAVGGSGDLRFLTIRRAATAAAAPVVQMLGVSIVSSNGSATHEWLVNVSP
jgi:hypothetical protein